MSGVNLRSATASVHQKHDSLRHELDVVGRQHAALAGALVRGVHPTLVDLLGICHYVANLCAVHGQQVYAVGDIRRNSRGI